MRSVPYNLTNANVEVQQKNFQTVQNFKNSVFIGPDLCENMRNVIFINILRIKSGNLEAISGKFFFLRLAQLSDCPFFLYSRVPHFAVLDRPSRPPGGLWRPLDGSERERTSHFGSLRLGAVGRIRLCHQPAWAETERSRVTVRAGAGRPWSKPG